MTRSVLHLAGMVKEKKKKPDHGRTAFYEHGGKSGMAMLKYPRIQKNAQRYITQPMPVGVLLPNGPCTQYLRSGNFAQHFLQCVLTVLML